MILPPFLPADLRVLLPNPAKGVCAEVLDGVVTFRQRVAEFYAWMFAVDIDGNVTGFSEAFQNKMCAEIPSCLNIATSTKSTTTSAGGGDDDGGSSTQSTASTPPCVLDAPVIFFDQFQRLVWAPVPGATKYEIFGSCTEEGSVEHIDFGASGYPVTGLCNGPVCETFCFWVQAHSEHCGSSALSNRLRCTSHHTHGG